MQLLLSISVLYYGTGVKRRHSLLSQDYSLNRCFELLRSMCENFVIVVGWSDPSSPVGFPDFLKTTNKQMVAYYTEFTIYYKKI